MQPVIYIQAVKHIRISHVTVKVKDICTIYCNDKKLRRIVENIVVCQLNKKDDGTKKTATILWLIGKIDAKLSGMADYENIGEPEFVMSVELESQKNNGKILKISLVSAITFFGSIFAVMSYNEDVSALELFGKISDIFGCGAVGVKFIAAGYSVGIAIGIVLFFNHFGRRKITTDPTPMEVEMQKYENDVDDTFIKKNSRRGEELDYH